MAVRARTSKYNKQYVHGSAVRATEHEAEYFEDELPGIPFSNKRMAAEDVSRIKNAQQQAPSVSLFAIIGFFVVAFLMIFVMLAQVNLNEVLRETGRLNSQIETLAEQQRILSIEFESVINMDEVERYARDVLGMSAPDTEAHVVIRAIPYDKVEIFETDSENDRLREIGEFLSFLFDEYIR